MFDLGAGELALILLVILVLFGPKKLPDLAQGIGKGLRQFRQAQKDFSDQINSAMREEERKKPASNLEPGNTISRGSSIQPSPEIEPSGKRDHPANENDTSSSSKPGDGDVRRSEEAPGERSD